MIDRKKSPERKEKKKAFRDIKTGLIEKMPKQGFKYKRESELKTAVYCLEKALNYESDNSPKIAVANYFMSAACYDNAAFASIALSEPRAAFKYFHKAYKYYSKASELNPEESRLAEMAQDSREMADICVYEVARRFFRNYRASMGFHARIDRIK